MTIAWTTVQNAIHAWLVSGSGLDAAHVIWGDQPGPRPSTPYIAIGTPTVRQVGQDHKTVTAAAVPAPLADIEIKLRGTREITFMVQCFGAAPVGASSCAGLLDTARAKQRLSTIHAALVAAGVHVTRCGPVVPLTNGQLGSAKFEPRAVMEVRVNLSSEVSELTTYIEVVEVTDDTRHKTFTVDSTP